MNLYAPHPRKIAAIALALALSGCQGELAAIPAVASPPAGQAAPETSPSPLVPADQGPLKITWDELNIPINPEAAFEPWMLTTGIKSLEGRQVRITGFMHGGVHQKDNIREFVLIKHLGCEFGATGHPQHVMQIELQDKLRTAFTAEPIEVEGTFHIRPWSGPDGQTWAIYHLDAVRVGPGMDMPVEPEASS